MTRALRACFNRAYEPLHTQRDAIRRLRHLPGLGAGNPATLSCALAERGRRLVVRRSYGHDRGGCQ